MSYNSIVSDLQGIAEDISYTSTNTDVRLEDLANVLDSLKDIVAAIGLPFRVSKLDSMLINSAQRDAELALEDIANVFRQISAERNERRTEP